jgi:hypothetical protein
MWQFLLLLFFFNIKKNIKIKKETTLLHKYEGQELYLAWSDKRSYL